MPDLPINFIKETAIYVKDLRRTKDFYEGVLGLQMITYSEGRHVFFRAGNSVLLCFISEETAKGEHLPRHFADGEIHYALEVPKEAYPKWREHILKKGIEIEKDVNWKPGVDSFYFRDPDRHCVEIITPSLWD